jgi:hypothetical protein
MHLHSSDYSGQSIWTNQRKNTSSPSTCHPIVKVDLLTHSLSLSLSHAHTRARAHTHTHTHTHTNEMKRNTNSSSSSSCTRNIQCPLVQSNPSSSTPGMRNQIEFYKSKVKLSLKQAIETYRVVRCQGSHIAWSFGS